MIETLNLQPISIGKQHLNTIYQSVETSLNITLSSAGKRTIRRDIDRYLLIYDNKIDKVLEYFSNYRDNIKKLYLGYNEDALNGIIKYLAK
jgi:hypothetical protein